MAEISFCVIQCKVIDSLPRLAAVPSGMLALLSVWIGLGSFVVAAAMLLYRPAMTDLTIPLVLYFGSPGSICFAGLVLWAHRKDDSPEPAVLSQRLQAKAAIGLAVFAAAIVYALIIGSHKSNGV